MTVPNPNPYASQPGPQAGGPIGYPGVQQQPQPQPWQQPYVPPVRDAGPLAPPRPKLTRAAAHRARLAGGIGGGLAWLGLGITQVSALFLLLPLLVGGLVYGLGFAVLQNGSSATAGVWSQTLEWLGSPWGIVLAIGIPAGIVIALLGLWLSTRMLRHPGIRRPVGVTWAGFGISAVASVLLSGLGSVSLPFFGGLPFDVDLGRGMGPGPGPGPMDQTDVQEWLEQGGSEVLERIADPGALLGMLGPWIALGQLLALIVPIAVSIFAWWWMAHAMRPAAADASSPAADGTAARAEDDPAA